MMAENSFRWRNSPAVIARYIHDRDVPDGSMVTLKPNEACVVVEDGKIAGVATQQHMEVNPKAGLLQGCLGEEIQSEPFSLFSWGPTIYCFVSTLRLMMDNQLSVCSI
jgi:hypothetical protein